VDTGSVQGTMREPRRSGVRRRKFRSVEQKRQMVQETLVPGASVAVVARRHGINANQLFSRRRQYRRGVLELVNASNTEESALIPVTLGQSEVSPDHPIAITSIAGTDSAGRIDIEFSGGRRGSFSDQTLYRDARAVHSIGNSYPKVFEGILKMTFFVFIQEEGDIQE
jgi:transposase